MCLIELCMKKVFVTLGAGLEVIKMFMLNSTEHKISTAHKE